MFICVSFSVYLYMVFSQSKQHIWTMQDKENRGYSAQYCWVLQSSEHPLLSGTSSYYYIFLCPFLLHTGIRYLCQDFTCLEDRLSIFPLLQTYLCIIVLKLVILFPPPGLFTCSALRECLTVWSNLGKLKSLQGLPSVYVGIAWPRATPLPTTLLKYNVCPIFFVLSLNI
jgi:uncharacterized membrane protein